MKKIFILDAVNYLFRSFFAIKGMKNKEGVPTNALFGFIRSIQKIFKEHNPDYFVAVFDGPDNKRSRTAIYQEYKSHREKMPPELYHQLTLAMDYCQLAGIPLLSVEGVEADDTIGSVARWATAHDFSSFLLSSDKDLAQLVNEKVSILNIHKDNLLINMDNVEEVYHVRADQIIDLLAIMGDTSDNIPGIPGMGPKTATKLLGEFDSLQNLLENVDQLKNAKQKDKILTHKDDALISYQLATINQFVEVPQEEEFYRLKSGDLDQLKEFFHDMSFSSLLKEIETTQHEQTDDVIYTCIDTTEKLSQLVKTLSSAKEICFDTETTHLQPMLAKLVGIGFAIEEKKAFYIPLNGPLDESFIRDALHEIFQNSQALFIGHNLKYDFHVLLNENIALPAHAYDTMIASYLLRPHINQHGLDQLVLDKYGKIKLSYKELTTIDKKQVTIDQIPIEEVCHYCCEDVDYTLRLKHHFENAIEQENLERVFREIEMPLLYVLLEMERRGIYINSQYFSALSLEFKEKLTGLEKNIYEKCGETFNIKSPKQLSHILFEKLELPYPGKKKKTGFSTKMEILETLAQDYPLAQEIIEYRLFEKLRSTYVDALPSQLNPHTHRIHPSFNQSVTATGRLSCTNPNLQNIPIRSNDGKKIRKGFIPQKENWSYLAADYSQIELRLLAHLSEDPKLIEAFLHDEDIHAFTASLMFNVPIEEVTKTMRYHAKTVNFGIIYGQQAFGLSKELGIDVKSAAIFIDKYFERYPLVKSFIEKNIVQAHELGYSQTLFGRKRPLDDLQASNKMIRMQAERFAINTPIQGTQADIIKMAMTKIQQALKQKKLRSYMVLQIHDELIFEAPDEELTELQEIVSEIMQNICMMKVPLKVDIAIGKNWGEC